jgi:hypothetical protein
MKMICLKCNVPLKYQENAPTNTGLSIKFRCEMCGAAISMETNAAETQLLSTIEMRFGQDTPSAESAGALKSDLRESGSAEGLEWTKEATQRLSRVPGIARMMAQSAIEQYARRVGVSVITPEVMDRVKEQVGH